MLNVLQIQTDEVLLLQNYSQILNRRYFELVYFFVQCIIPVFQPYWRPPQYNEVISIINHQICSLIQLIKENVVSQKSYVKALLLQLNFVCLFLPQSCFVEQSNRSCKQRDTFFSLQGPVHRHYKTLWRSGPLNQYRHPRLERMVYDSLIVTLFTLFQSKFGVNLYTLQLHHIHRVTSSFHHLKKNKKTMLNLLG